MARVLASVGGGSVVAVAGPVVPALSAVLVARPAALVVPLWVRSGRGVRRRVFLWSAASPCVRAPSPLAVALALSAAFPGLRFAVLPF